MEKKKRVWSNVTKNRDPRTSAATRWIKSNRPSGDYRRAPTVTISTVLVQYHIAQKRVSRTHARRGGPIHKPRARQDYHILGTTQSIQVLQSSQKVPVPLYDGVVLEYEAIICLMQALHNRFAHNNWATGTASRFLFMLRCFGDG